MKHSSNYKLVKRQLLRRLKSADSNKDSAGGTFENNESVRMVETRLFIGLNDAQTKKQIFETGEYEEQLKKICFSYHVPFSLDIEDGGYYHESGEYVEEKTLVLTLIDAEKETIKKIAKVLCMLFNQESVLMTENVINGCYISISEE